MGAIHKLETRPSGSTGFCGRYKKAANFTALRDSQANFQLELIDTAVELTRYHQAPIKMQ